jgi:hypothetical protein
MFNPLLEDLTKLKDQEIESKIGDLSKKYWIAARAGQGHAAEQMVMIMDALRMEQQRRQVELAKKAQASTPGFDDLIKIN